MQAEVLSKIGVNKSKLKVIPNGVDTDIWLPINHKKQTSKQFEIKKRVNGNRIFLYMGRIASEKNVEALLRAWKQESLENCTLVIVGDGPLRPTLENNFPPGDNQDILWWGYESDLETKIALLQCSEVFLLPSLVEGLSISLLEAMSTGTACIATDAGADGEVLEDGAGIVLSTENVTSQLRTLLPLLKNFPTLTAELGQRARERVIDRYTLKQNIDSLERLYNCFEKSSHISTALSSSYNSLD